MEEPDDIPKIICVIANYDGNTMSRGFYDVVTALGDEASANEGDIGQGIDGRKFADGVEQQNTADDRFTAPKSAPPETNSKTLEERPDGGKSFRMPGSEDHHGSRMRGQDVLKGLQEHAFLFFVHGASTNQDRPRFSAKEIFTKAGNDIWWRRGSDVELQISSYDDALFRSADRNQPLLILPGLCEELVDVPQNAG
jgi:hypothetical protein